MELSVVNMSDNLISVNNVSVNFDYQENFISKKQKIHAVNNINIQIKKGSFFGLVGESGSGKLHLVEQYLEQIKLVQEMLSFMMTIEIMI